LLIPKTPASIAEVQSLMDQLKRGTLIDPVIVLEKVSKAASLAIADSIILKVQNQDFIDQSKEQQRQKNRQGGELGNARVLDEDALSAHEWKLFKKIFNHMNSDIFTWVSAVEKRSAPKLVSSVKVQRQFDAAIKPLLRLGPVLELQVPGPIQPSYSP
jgi:hypothetical protein